MPWRRCPRRKLSAWLYTYLLSKPDNDTFPMFSVTPYYGAWQREIQCVLLSQEILDRAIGFVFHRVTVYRTQTKGVCVSVPLSFKCLRGHAALSLLPHCP